MPLGALILGVHAPSFTPNTPEHALARWVTSQGGFVGSVAAETRGGLRGLYVTRPVSAGELLVSVPRACVISAEEDPQWGLSLRELLTARLCGALSRGECEPYTRSLPEAEPLLCERSEASLQPWPLPSPLSARPGPGRRRVERGRAGPAAVAMARRARAVTLSAATLSAHPAPLSSRLPMRKPPRAGEGRGRGGVCDA